MNGKSKCRILKEIRRQIASQNDIEYVTSECKFQGECAGTCPKCEAELRYLEAELQKRQRAGKAVAMVGIAAALVVGTAGCTSDLFPSKTELTGDMPYVEQTEGAVAATDPTEEVILMGDVPVEADPPAGDVALPDVTEEPEIAGGIAYTE